MSCLSALLLLLLALQHETIEGILKIWGFDFPAYNYLAINLFHAKRFLFYCILFLLLLWAGCESGWKKWASVLLTICLIADLFGIMGFYGKEKTADYFKKTRIEEIITADRGWFRTFSTAKTTAQESFILLAGCSPFEAMKEKHLPTLNMLYNIHDMWGLDVIRLQRSDDLYGAFTTRAFIDDTNLLELYGVKYVVSVTPLDKQPRFELVSARLEGLAGAREELIKKNTIKLYKNHGIFRNERGWLKTTGCWLQKKFFRHFSQSHSTRTRRFFSKSSRSGRAMLPMLRNPARCACCLRAIIRYGCASPCRRIHCWQ